MFTPQRLLPAARKARWFWPVLATLVLADCSSKELVTFNVADVGVTVGAVLLAIVLWREDGMEETA